MESLLLDPRDVHSDDEPMPFTLADLEWWAEHSNRPGAPSLPLADWFECEAATWRVSADDEPTADDEALCLLVARHLDGLARSARFHRAATAEDLAGRSGSPCLRATCDPAALAIPYERHESDLAERLDAMARRYRADGDGRSCLAAWALEQLAEQAEMFASQTVAQYLDSEAAFRMAEVEAMFDDATN